MKNTKKKIFSIALAACLIVLSIAGASVAYFTDVEEAQNVFTSGNVSIALNYAGHEVSDGAVYDADDQSTYPGKTVEINASIKNVGTENAYVGAIISLSKDADLKTLIAPADLETLLTDLVVSGSEVKYVETTTGYDIYVVKTAAIAKDASAAIFSDVVIPEEWDNDDMKLFNGVTLNVKAYATQTVGTGFDTAANALAIAFEDDWDAYATATVLD